MNITSPQDIKSCEIVHDWVDDHEVCVGVTLNGVTFGAWWAGWETAGAFRYWDSPSAKEAIVEYIRNAAKSYSEYAAEDPDEVTPEDLPQ